MRDEDPEMAEDLGAGEVLGEVVASEVVGGGRSVLRVSAPIFWEGRGILMWETEPGFFVEVRTDDGGVLRIDDELGTMVGLGWEYIGFETGIVDDDAVEVAKVTVVGGTGRERFYLIDIVSRKVFEIETLTVSRAVGAAVKKLLEQAITEDALNEGREDQGGDGRAAEGRPGI